VRGRAEEGDQGEEAGRMRTHLLSHCSGTGSSCLWRVLYLLEARRRAGAVPEGVVAMEGPLLTRLADVDGRRGARARTWAGTDSSWAQS